jgi:hypothetical protein
MGNELMDSPVASGKQQIKKREAVASRCIGDDHP